jgi:DNA integrity scanning protein DisA with diadenylate cyclase activity
LILCSGGISKLWKKVGPGIADVTQMNSEFTKAIEQYDKYKELINELVDRLEAAIQQNPTVLEVSYRV